MARPRLDCRACPPSHTGMLLDPIASSPPAASPMPPPPLFTQAPSELCMLASPWDGVVPPGGLIGQEKIDGWRACWIDGELRTRGGGTIEGIQHIAEELRRFERAFPTRMFFDGEFQVDGTLAATKRYAERGWREGGALGRFYIFDAVPREEWRRDACQVPLTERLAALDAGLGSFDAEHIKALPWSPYGTAEVVLMAATDVWARGGEGLVVKAAGSLYRRSRSRDWMKVK